jgi:hypothetical protein
VPVLVERHPDVDRGARLDRARPVRELHGARDPVHHLVVLQVRDHGPSQVGDDGFLERLSPEQAEERRRRAEPARTLEDPYGNLAQWVWR